MSLRRGFPEWWSGGKKPGGGKDGKKRGGRGEIGKKGKEMEKKRGKETGGDRWERSRGRGGKLERSELEGWNWVLAKVGD